MLRSGVAPTKSRHSRRTKLHVDAWPYPDHCERYRSLTGNMVRVRFLNVSQRENFAPAVTLPLCVFSHQLFTMAPFFLDTIFSPSSTSMMSFFLQSRWGFTDCWHFAQMLLQHKGMPLSFSSCLRTSYSRTA